MGTKVKHWVTVDLGLLASRVIGGRKRGNNGYLSSGAARAIRCYLNDRETAGSGWAYPSFLDESKGGAKVELRIGINEDLWHSLEREAERQHVSPSQMLEHAVLYFAAEVDAGRYTERILDELDEG